MQDLTREDADGAEGAPSAFQQLKRAVSTAVGAVVAMALLSTVALWFYQLGMRDAENIPIIRASLEPAKTRPDDPGGVVAPHQDISSYSIAESGPPKATAAVLAPPPPEPRREDVPMGELTQTAAPDARPANAGPGAGAAGMTATVAGPDAVPEADAVEPEAEPEDAAGEPVADPVRSGSDFAPPRSPVAPPRPPDLRQRIQAAVEEAEQDAADLVRRAAASDVQIQLAADPDESTVRTMWQRIYEANDDILRGRELAVQATMVGGTKYYRLRVGPFDAPAEARAVCQALKARGQDCIVARNG